MADYNIAKAEHTHAQDDVTGLNAALAGKAASSHTHTVANVTGLQVLLNDLEARVAALEEPEA